MAEQTICGLVNLTVKCNQDCVFCCDGDVKGTGHHLTLDQAKAKIAQVASTGARSVTFIGGEPLIRKDIVEIVGAASQAGMKVCLTSNGTLLTRQLLRRLTDAGLTSIEISVHSFDPDLADRISRRKHTAERQARALELLTPHPSPLTPHVRPPTPEVSINFVVFSRNYQQLPAFVETVAERYGFIGELFINFLDPVGYPAEDPSLVPTYTEVKPYLLRGLDMAAAAGIPFTVDSVPGCMLDRYFLFLRGVREKARGVLYAKETHGIANPQPDSDLSQYYRVNACFDCPAADLCPGVNFRYLEIHGQKEFLPLPEHFLEEGAHLVPADLAGKLPSCLPCAPRASDFAAHATPLVLTTECNNRCDRCQCRSVGERALSPLALARKLDRLAERESSTPVLLTGGEAPLHPNFFRILALLSRNGRKVGFTTNGRVFSYAKWAERAARSGVSWVVVRLPASSGKIDEVTKVPGAEAQTLVGIDNLLSTRAFHVRVEESESPPSN